VAFHFSGHSELVEGALGHPGEDENEGIFAVLLVAFHEGDHVEAEPEEGAVEETVHQEHLT